LDIAVLAAIVALVLIDAGRFVQVQLIDRAARRAEAARPPAPTPAEVVEAARSLPAPAAANPLDDLVKHRYIVTMRGNEGMFGGVLTEADTITTPSGSIDVILVLEQCSTMAGHDGDTPGEIAGRVILAMSGIAYMQQLG
jgi:hypothetical protein